MTAHLPPALLSLFAPRPPIPPMGVIEKKTLPPITGLGDYLSHFATVAPPNPQPTETKNQKKERFQKEKDEKNKMKLEEAIAKWDPSKDPNVTTDAYRTLFVGRLNFSTSEHKLKREFEIYGAIKKVRIVVDKKGNPKGYAFIEFERERDMKTAYRAADGKKIDGKRIVVDVERGRTTRNWRPRYLGGGLGFTRKGPEEVNQKYSGREVQEGGGSSSTTERGHSPNLGGESSGASSSSSHHRRHDEDRSSARRDSFRDDKRDNRERNRGGDNKERDSHDRYRGREGRDRRDNYKPSSSSSNRRERSRDRG